MAKTPGALTRAPGPGPPLRSGGPGGAVFAQDPLLHPLDLAARPIRRAEIVEVLALGAGAERARGEGQVHLPVGAAPQREPDQLHPDQRGLVLENDPGVAHAALRPS